MAQVAYISRTYLKDAAATAKLKDMYAAANKSGVYECAERIAAQLIEVANGGGVTVDERIKVEVKDIDEVRLIEARPDFIRFSNGGFPTIYDLIAVRKQQGKSDWYA